MIQQAMPFAFRATLFELLRACRLTFAASAALIGVAGHAQDSDPPGYQYEERFQPAGIGISMPSATYQVASTEISVKGNGAVPDFNIVRYYSSDLLYSSRATGMGGALNVVWPSYRTGNSFVLTNGVERFEFRPKTSTVVYNDVTVFDNLLRSRAKLYYNSAFNNPSYPQHPGLSLVREDGSTWNFKSYVDVNARYQLQSVVYPNGYKISFAYDANMHLKFVHNSLGHGYYLNWTGPGTTADSWKVISSIHFFRDIRKFCNLSALTCADANSNSKVEYAYEYKSSEMSSPSKFPTLIRIDYPDGSHSQLAYDTYKETASGYWYSVTQTTPRFYRLISTSAGSQAPGYVNSYVSGSYPGTASVHSQTMATGSVFTYGYTPMVNAVYGRSVSLNGSAIQSFQIKRFLGSPSLRSKDAMVGLSDALNRSYAFEYDSNLRLQKTSYPEGNSVSLFFDSNENVTRESKASKLSSDPSLDVNSTFISTCIGAPGCFAIASQTNPMNRQTLYSYSGGLLSSVQNPEVSAGLRPTTRYSYVQRQAWLSDGAGGYVPSPDAVWLKSEERTCRASATLGNACSNGSSDEVITTYDYGPNSGPNDLRLRGVAVTADGQTLRTCYGYDDLGRKISETSPNANLTSCP